MTGDVARAWAVVEDVQTETGPFVECADLERLMEACPAFEVEDQKWVRMWRCESRGLVFTIHKNSQVTPVDQAQWLVGKILAYDLLPEGG